MKKNFKILGIQQIAIGCLDREKAKNLWVNLLGLEKIGFYENQKENVKEDILRVGPKEHPIEIDIMEPIDKEKKPKVYEPPLNHIGLWVDDLDNCTKYLKNQGVRFAPGGIRIGASGHRVCFIHPKSNDEFPIGGGGVLIELVEYPSKNKINVV